MHVVVDRPIGSLHPDDPSFVYELNYGFIPGTMAPDGEPLDAYVIDADAPLTECDAEVIAIIRRRNDIEDKLVVRVGSSPWNSVEIESKTRFQEQWFDTFVESTSLNHVNIDMRKFPDHLHWQFGAFVLGTDEHGTWLHVPTGTMARRGEEPARKLEVGFIGLVPSGGQWWMAEFYLSHPWHLIYVNIGTPPEWDGDRIHQIDLDLDVALRPDGSIHVLDEDEFALHQVRYAYPTDLIAAARTATESVVASLENREPPFDGSAQVWLESVDQESLR